MNDNDQTGLNTSLASPYSSLYTQALESLVGVIQRLSQAKTTEAVMGEVREAARKLTNADGATLVLRDGDQCHYVDENAIAPLWKGKRFPMSACISGWVMLNAKPAIIEDIYQDSRIPQDVYKKTFVKSLVMVPIGDKNPMGAIGNYWSTKRKPSVEEVVILQALADTTCVAMANIQLYQELKQKIQTLKHHEKQIQDQHHLLEVFTHALAHDLKQPLRTMTSYSQLCIGAHSLDDNLSSHLKYIHQASDRMTQLVDSVFRFIQINDPENNIKEPFSTEFMVRSLEAEFEELIQSREIHLSYSQLPTLFGNSAQIKQVLSILLSNAILHNNPGVSVHIHFEEQADQWMCSVTDKGTGIEPQNLSKIFLPFKRLSNLPNSVGLGLAIAQTIILKHGGTLVCDSKVDQGSTFTFSLPKPKASQLPSQSAKSKQAKYDQGEKSLATCLIVDDSEPDIEMTKYILQTKNKIKCNLIEAYGGQQALDKLQQMTAEHQATDFLLLDIDMPGIDGFEFMNQIKKYPALKNIPIIVFSGSINDKDKQKAISLGAKAYLVKPLNLNDFIMIIRNTPSLTYEDRNDYAFICRT